MPHCARTQKLGTDRVQSIGSQLVVALHDLKHIELKTTLHVDRLALAVSISF